MTCEFKKCAISPRIRETSISSNLAYLMVLFAS